jgi:hypothetical protein
MAAELELQDKIIALLEDVYSKFEKDQDHYMEAVMKTMNLSKS